MSHYELKLKGFEFPENLDNDNANFRFLIDLRFKDDKEQYITKQAVMPGVDTYWECDTGKYTDRNFVRAQDERGNYLYQFNMCAIDEWDKLILIVKGKELHSIRFSVYDVNRKGGWEALKGFGEKLLEVGVSMAVGKIKDSAAESIASHIPDSLGDAASDISSLLIQKIAGCDNVLFTGSYQFNNEEREEPPPVKGKGKNGDYTICFSSKKIGE